MHVGVAGAGLIGRLVAHALAERGLRVSVFDPAGGPDAQFDGRGAAAFSAAGMLSPLAEREVASDAVAALGWRSIALWIALLPRLPEPPRFHAKGSLLLAHRGDIGTAKRMLARLTSRCGADRAPMPLDAAALAALEPALHGPAEAWLLPGEGLIDPVQTLRALYLGAAAVQWHWGCRVVAVEPGALHLEGARRGCREFDAVFDARGLGAREDLPLRGVRGETVWLQLPGHGLTRPVRLMHPRQRVYLAPRSDDLIVVGASEIESEDRSEVSLKSAVELMVAAHSVMPTLHEARIVRLDRNLRPALPDNEPRVDIESRRVRINGLFRHGWLLGPALVERAIDAWSRLAGAALDRMLR